MGEVIGFLLKLRICARATVTDAEQREVVREVVNGLIEFLPYAQVGE